MYERLPCADDNRRQEWQGAAWREQFFLERDTMTIMAAKKRPTVRESRGRGIYGANRDDDPTTADRHLPLVGTMNRPPRPRHTQNNGRSRHGSLNGNHQGCQEETGA